MALGMEPKVGEGTLPQDHEGQLQLGIRIITSAFQDKMHAMEHEIRGLRLTCEEQRNNQALLQKKTSTLEVELHESHQRSQALAEENKELFKTVGSLRKQISRLENLKAAVMSSIQDDHAQEADQPYDSRALMNEEYLRGAAPLTHGLANRDDHYGQGAVSAPRAQAPPQSYPQVSALHAQSHSEGLSSFGGTSPPVGGGGGSPVIDGKHFFKQARSRLSYEAFNLFLASIKRLNNQQQSREETLEEARTIFGAELQDLYKDFENLLNRHGM